MVNIDNLFKMISERGITQSKLAESTSISTGNISDWKKGKSMPSAVKLDELANYFDCSVDYLLGRTDNPDNSISNNIIIGHDNSGTATVNGDIQSNNEAIIEIETIISKLTGASRYRAIADVLEVLEKYA